jgi:ATP-dependent RNA helicase DDX47/RRP3
LQQYDLEVWARIEHALGKQVPEHVINKDEAMVYTERVSEAQREAIKEMKSIHEQRGKGGRGGRGGARGGARGGRRGRDQMDREEG